MKTARPAVPARSADASLGRQTRGLVGPARRGARVPARATMGRIRNPLRVVTPARAAALLGMLAAGFAMTFVTGPTAFGLTRVDVPTLTWTDPALVRQALALPAGGNVFQLDTRPLVTALRALPTVADAEISVELPDAAVVVRVDERQPVLAWQVGHTRYIADREGLVFATLDDTAALPAGVAVIEDRRGTPLKVGSRIDAVDLDVATRLGSLRPGDVGSSAARLLVAITSGDGFTVAVSSGWTAVFGFYSPATRPADMIPGQVRLLRSLLLDREATASRIVLASETSGTVVLKGTPKPAK
jgi:hypothetical protein